MLLEERDRCRHIERGRSGQTIPSVLLGDGRIDVSLRSAIGARGLEMGISDPKHPGTP